MALPPQKRSKRSRAFSRTSVAVERAVEAVVVVELEDDDKLAAPPPAPAAAALEAIITSTSNIGSSRTRMVVPGKGFLFAVGYLAKVDVGLSVVSGDFASLLLLLGWDLFFQAALSIWRERE